MKVELLHHTPLNVLISGIRTCWKSHDKSDDGGMKDQELISKIIRYGHTSTLEHINYTFQIQGVSRALLQEFARHRVGVSPSVESTRFTLKRMLGDNNISQYLYNTGDPQIDEFTSESLSILSGMNKQNDILKYGIPEAYLVNMQVTMNARALRHMIGLRYSKKALKEFQNLAYCLYECVISSVIDHYILFEDLFKEDQTEEKMKEYEEALEKISNAYITTTNDLYHCKIANEVLEKWK